MKKITIGVLLTLFSFFSAFAQVQIGSGTNLSQPLPFNISKGYSYTQSIYLNSEINTTGTISSLQWYFDGNSPLLNNQDLVIYLGTTAKTNFTSSTDWVPYANLTQVYSGVITTDSAPGWKTITFTTPFVYNGADNLVVGVDENTAGSDGVFFKFRSFQTSNARSISYANNSTNPNPATPPTTGASNFTSYSYLPNIILGGITQTCFTPLNISINNIGETSFVVDWENQGSVAPSGGYEIYLSTENTTPSLETAPSFIVPAGQMNFAITGLVPTTTYYVWVKANCSTTESSAFSEVKTATTAAVAVTSFFESFETAVVPNLPLGWSKIVRGPSLPTTANVKSVATNINITPQSIMFSTGTASVLDDVILVSTNVSNIAAANNRLNFFARGTGVLQIGTLSTNDENAVFTNVEEVPLTNTTTLYKVAFDYEVSTDNFIGIRLVTSGASFTAYVDDIRWEPIPTCPDVTELSVPEVSPTTATINWVSNSGTETAWHIAIAPSTTLTPEGLTFSSVGVTGSYTAVDLLADSQYKVWVRSVCGADLGSWIGPVVFRTDCEGVSQIIENFDTTPTLSLPSCWSKILRGDTLATAANVRTIALNPNSGTLSLQMSNSSSTGDFDVIAVLPRVSNLSLGTYRLKFFAKGAGVLQVGTVDYPTNAGTFTSINSVSTSAVYTEYVIDFAIYTGTDTHIGIRLATDTSGNTIYLDDIVWEPIPLCPDATSIEINNLAATTATINWSENGTVSEWNIAIGVNTDIDPSTLPFFTSASESYNATGLTPNTSHKVWVRSVCGTDNGAWIGPILFTTSCPAVDTINENFDTTTTPNLSDCWTKIIRGATVSASASVISFNYFEAQSSPNVIKLFNANSSGAYDIMLVSPLMNENVVNGSRVKFYAKSLTVDGVLDIVTLNSSSATATYTVISTIPLTNTMTEYVVNLDAAASSDTYVGFRLNATTDYKTLYVDNVVIEALPTCVDVTGIEISDITSTTANLEWFDNEIETSWDVAVGPASATDPSALEIVSTSFNGIVLTELTASTTYKVWVRSVCTEGNGGWVGPLSFSTSCNPATTLSENFDTVSYPNLPICWTSFIGNGATTDSGVAVGAGGFQNTNSATIYASNSPIGANVILISPALSNIGAANQILTFKAEGSNNLVVGTLNSNGSDIVFTPFQTINIIESLQDKTVDFSTYTGTDTYIGFRIETGSTSTASQYIGIDNVVWGPNLNTGSVDLVASAIYPNPVQDVLNITNSDELQSVTIYNLMGQQVLSATTNLSTIDMSHLTSGAYLVKLSSDNATKTLKVIKN